MLRNEADRKSLSGSKSEKSVLREKAIVRRTPIPLCDGKSAQPHDAKRVAGVPVRTKGRSEL